RRRIGRKACGPRPGSAAAPGSMKNPLCDLTACDTAIVADLRARICFPTTAYRRQLTCVTRGLDPRVLMPLCTPPSPRASLRQTRRHHRLDRGRDGHEAAVGAVFADQHEADRRLAGMVTRDRNRAAVEEIRECGIAQPQKVCGAVGRIRDAIVEARRGYGVGR